jgi:hypothetical protein
MGAMLLVLLILSAVLAFTALVLLRMRRFRSRYSTRQTARVIGVSQIVLGALWLGWGIGYLQSGGSARIGGWYAVLLGALWALQGARRLIRMRAPRR